jgi:hypothetical protein
MTRCPATNPDAVPVDRRNDYLLARWSLVGGMADRSGDPLGYLQRNAMFSPAKKAIDPHSPNTPLASPGGAVADLPDMASAERSRRGFEDPRRDSVLHDREARAS